MYETEEIIVDTIVYTESDIYFSNYDEEKSQEKDLLKSMKKMSMDEDICKEFKTGMEISPRFHEIESDIVTLSYSPYNYVYLTNDRGSKIRCHFTDSFYLLNSIDFKFKRAKSMARLDDGNYIFRLAFTTTRYSYYDSGEESDDIC